MHVGSRYILCLWLLLMAAPAGVRGQVEVCYTFEGVGVNTRPMGWGALPNLDFHHVGIDANNPFAHGGDRALGNGRGCITLMPDEGVDYGADGVWLLFWYLCHSSTGIVEVGYVTDATDSSTFHLLASLHGWPEEWHPAAVDLASVPTGARLALRGDDRMVGSEEFPFLVDDMRLTSSPHTAWGLHRVWQTADSARVEWQQVGSPQLTLAVGSTEYHPTAGGLTFATAPGVQQEVVLSAVAPDGGCLPLTVVERLRLFPYRQGACLDAHDYLSAMALPGYGTPVEPYMHTGTRTQYPSGINGIYAGSHSPNYNQGAEVGTGMMVFPRTIPPGDDYTLRLGNRLGDWESSSVLYTLMVDTAEGDLLVMKYTVAMDDGSHISYGTEAVAQHDTLHPPWFRVELLDDTLAALESCEGLYLEGFSPDGWDATDERNAYYSRRNFSSLLFDLRPHHGCRLHLRVTASEGVVNNRWCYAYYNFGCSHRYQEAADCDADSLTLEAPWGFAYRWWREGEEAETLSTGQSLAVPPDGSLYHCEITELHAPHCSLTLDRRAVGNPTLTVEDTVVENELPHVYLGEIFDGTADTVLVLPGETGCDTLLHYRLHVWPNQMTARDTTVCPDGWPVDFEGHTFDGPDSVTLVYTDMHGADSSVVLVAVEAPQYEVWDTIEILPGRPFVYDSVDYGGPVDIDLTLSTVQGCDSLVHLSLVHADLNKVLYLQFPNLVTPNGDGVNDRWEVVNLLEFGLYPMNELWIYNPWGVLIYHVENISDPEDFWDPEATRSPDGTYYFRFAAQNRYGTIRRNGLIEVVR